MTSLFLKSPLRTEMREFTRLAIPLATAQVAQAATGFVDTVMMGWLGQATLAAGGLAVATFTVLLVTAIGTTAGVSPLVAQAMGAGNPTRIRQVTQQGLWFAVLLALPMMLLLSQIDGVMRQLGQDPATIALAKTYLDVMLWGYLPALGFAVLRSVVSSLAVTRPIMLIVTAATLFNAIGNYVFGFGKLGFPALGLSGLALSSVLAYLGMFLSLLIYLLHHPQLQTYRLLQGMRRFEPPILRELISLGIPIGVSTALETSLFTATTYLMGTLGTAVLAAHQIVLQTIAVIFMVPLGMSFAATVRVGFWSGQQNLERARQAGYVSIALGGLFMSLMAIVLLTFPRQVIGLYLDLNDPDNANVLSLTFPILVVAALSQVLDGMQKTATGALYGLKDTRIPMLLSFLAFWGVGLAGGYWLGFYRHLGGVGLWLGLAIGIALSAIVFIWRFWHLTARQPLS